jgi:hypothetical protein
VILRKGIIDKSRARAKNPARNAEIRIGNPYMLAD